MVLRPRSEYLPVDQDTLKSGGYSDTTRPEKVALRQSSRRFFQVVGKKTVTFDRKEQIGHSYDYPAKRRRATLRSDPSRDNRMRMRRIFRPGKPQPASPPLNTAISRAASNASKKPRGSRGRAPDFCRLFKNAKIPFHAEPRHLGVLSRRRRIRDYRRIGRQSYASGTASPCQGDGYFEVCYG